MVKFKATCIVLAKLLLLIIARKHDLMNYSLVYNQLTTNDFFKTITFTRKKGMKKVLDLKKITSRIILHAIL